MWAKEAPPLPRRHIHIRSKHNLLLMSLLQHNTTKSLLPHLLLQHIRSPCVDAWGWKSSSLQYHLSITILHLPPLLGVKARKKRIEITIMAKWMILGRILWVHMVPITTMVCALLVIKTFIFLFLFLFLFVIPSIHSEYLGSGQMYNNNKALPSLNHPQGQHPYDQKMDSSQFRNRPM